MHSSSPTHAYQQQQQKDTILVHPSYAPYIVTAIDYRRGTLTLLMSAALPHSTVDYEDPFPLLCNLGYAVIVSCLTEITPSNRASNYIFGPISCLSNTSYFSYLVDGSAHLYVLPLDCKVVPDSFFPMLNFSEATFTYCSYDISGFKIFHDCTQCEIGGQYCGFNPQRNQTFCMNHGSHLKVLAATSSVDALVVLLLMVATALYFSLNTRYNEEIHLKVEMFLRTHGTSKPTRYTFSEVKKIARRFKEKVGQGGFGSVYKGELPNGVPVAIKMLENSTGEGEEFINEVATIGLIHHANIALHEEWNTYIKDATNASSTLTSSLTISCLTTTSIQRSDFGLAKLCARDQSIITLTAARGTMGYIAPEFYSRSFGGISHKSDVYSFGMLVLEMVSGRRNSDPSVDSQNEVYLPEWIFEKVITGQDVVPKEMTGEEREKVRQLTIVGLWCIQWNPRNRPSMTKVVNMLTGRLENLQMPPKPFGDAIKHEATMLSPFNE
ncbi:unnamed protein product [Miscanthus lutarioriparius]|uniref:Protein kinase domain-containing protein n=1 Tax=Miscanthus lutarioriparius TaxID=422564 RepID=A0A811PYV8_9POAL|nr:unnamed protein product [Miscanthus lutarioriparius]